MAYKALYRQWRPLTFDDVVGQQHTTTTLKNEIVQGRIGHAYLFSGSRGTGKTSTARILSRAINCLEPENGNPCNKCSNCLGILGGTILDITEIDAASNNGVDNIRSLREEARFSGSTLSHRVYIVDEVHMLSTSAFNALLKLLEEPPSHVHFILATTEAHKIPATISSRCQRFDFKRITLEDAEKQLRKILSGGDVQFEEHALHIIAEAADGSMRDALSILDQCLSIGEKRLTYDMVADFLGTAEREKVFRLIESIQEGSVKNAFSAVEEVVGSGKSIPPFADEFVKILRDMLFCKYNASPEDMQSEDAEVIANLAAGFTPERLVALLTLACNAQTLFRTSVNPRLTLEISLVKMINPVYDLSAEAMAARLTSLEEKIAKGVIAPPAPAKKTAKPKPKPAARVDSESLKKIKDSWKNIIDDLFAGNHLQLAMALGFAALSEENGKVLIVYKNHDEFTTYKKLLDGELEPLTNAVEKFTSLRPEMVIRYEQEETAEEQDALMQLYNENN